jgi:predicted DNA-binding transcriptional regulator AlpA
MNKIDEPRMRGPLRDKFARVNAAGFNDDLLLTEPETAEICGLSHHTLKRWRLQEPGKGPAAMHVHRCVRYRAATVRDWIRAHASEAAD